MTQVLMVQLMHKVLDGHGGNREKRKMANAKAILNMYANMGINEDIGVKLENAIRDHLSGSGRKTTMNLMWTVIHDQFPKVKEPVFKKVWDSLIADDFLVKRKDGSYEWEM